MLNRIDVKTRSINWYCPRNQNVCYLFTAEYVMKFLNVSRAFEKSKYLSGAGFYACPLDQT